MQAHCRSMEAAEPWDMNLFVFCSIIRFLNNYWKFFKQIFKLLTLPFHPKNTLSYLFIVEVVTYLFFYLLRNIGLYTRTIHLHNSDCRF